MLSALINRLFGLGGLIELYPHNMAPFSREQIFGQIAMTLGRLGEKR